MSPIVIQQQNADIESVESIKINRTRPTTSSLLDSKNCSKDCNLAIGIFSPFKAGIESYLPDANGNSYDIRKLKDTFRTMEILVSRDGEMGGIIGLLFDGATCNWAELPPPGNVTEMNKVYNYVKTLK